MLSFGLLPFQHSFVRRRRYQTFARQARPHKSLTALRCQLNTSPIRSNHIHPTRDRKELRAFTSRTLNPTLDSSLPKWGRTHRYIKIIVFGWVTLGLMWNGYYYIRAARDRETVPITGRDRYAGSDYVSDRVTHTTMAQGTSQLIMLHMTPEAQLLLLD